jgi:hypothetical protein
VNTDPSQVKVTNDGGTTPANLLWKTFVRIHSIQNKEHADMLRERMFVLMNMEDGQMPTLQNVIVFQMKFAKDTDFVELVLRLDPEASKLAINGKLPLHVAASFPLSLPKHHVILWSSWFPMSTHDPMELILSAYPLAVRQRDVSGRLVLHIALAQGRRFWWSGIERLVEAYPESLTQRDPVTCLYPFQLAIMDVADEDDEAVATAYHLLLACPEVLSQSLHDEPRLPYRNWGPWIM